MQIGDVSKTCYFGNGAQVFIGGKHPSESRAIYRETVPKNPANRTAPEIDVDEPIRWSRRSSCIVVVIAGQQLENKFENAALRRKRCCAIFQLPKRSSKSRHGMAAR